MKLCQATDRGLSHLQNAMKLAFGAALILGALFLLCVADPFSPATTAQDIVRRIQSDASRTGRSITLYANGELVSLPQDTDLGQLLRLGQWERTRSAPETVGNRSVTFFADNDPAEECSLCIYPEVGMARAYDWWGPPGRETVWYTIPDGLSDILPD